MFITISCGNSIPNMDIEISEQADSIINPSSKYIVVLGDVQTYTQDPSLNIYLARSLAWVNGQQNHFGNILCLLQDGDVSNDNYDYQWKAFGDNVSAISKSIPTIVSTGNHDYFWDSDNDPRSSTKINNYLYSYFPHKLIEHSYEEGSVENVIVRNFIHGQRYDIVALEFAPRPQVVMWADSIIAANPDKKYFVMTHEFLLHGKMVKRENSYALRHFKEYPACAPDEIWEMMIRRRDNIVAVLCGHNGFSEQRESENDYGRLVPQILFNLQYQTNGGDTMVELWEFPEKGDSANVRVYHTWERRFLDTPETNYRFRYRY